jgi:hypothetical protein
MSNSKKTDLNKFQKKWKEYLNKWGSKYYPDEPIITRRGCICKKKFIPTAGEHKGNTINNACIPDTNTYSIQTEENKNWWCDVSGSECGLDHSKRFNKDKGKWDYCNLEGIDTILNYTNTGISNTYNYQTILGLFIFIIIFMILIPLLLIHFKFYNFLHVYMPNFDLLATSMSWDNGPGGRNNRLFQSLYNRTKPKSMMGLISTTFINFVSLVGLIFLLIKTYIEHSNKQINKKTNKKTNKKFVSDALVNTLETGMIMLLITYLLPNPIITQIQETLRVFLFEKFNLTRESLLLYFIIVSAGLLFSTLCILTEMYLIKMKIFSPIIEKIYSFLSLL